MIWGLLIAAAIVFACNCLGVVAASVVASNQGRRRTEREVDRYTMVAYAFAVGGLCAVIW